MKRNKFVTKMFKSCLFEDIFDFLTWKTYIWILDGKFISLIQPMQSCRIIFEMNAWFGQKLAIFFPAIRFELKKREYLYIFVYFSFLTVISHHGLLYLVAYRFGRVEFRIFVVVCFRQVHLKKPKQIFNILNSKFDTSKSMSYQGHS